MTLGLGTTVQDRIRDHEKEEKKSLMCGKIQIRLGDEIQRLFQHVWPRKGENEVFPA